MRILMFILISSLICSCKSKNEIKFREFNGVEFVHCGSFYEGTIFVKNIENIRINDLVKFAYCYTGEYDFTSLVINSEYYAGNSIWTGNHEGKTLFSFEFEFVDFSNSAKEVDLHKIVKAALQNYNDKLLEIPKDKFQLQYECN